MSRVTLLAVDRPVPLYEPAQGGFAVHALKYYRTAVEELGLSIKPVRYELDLEDTEQDARLLRDYLKKYAKPGERVELWNLWVGEVNAHGFRLAGRLDDLDGDTLQQLRERDQTCITLTI